MLVALALGALATPVRALTLSAVGDVLLWYGPMAGTLHNLTSTAQRPWDPAVYPFERVEPYLKGMVFGNLEGPLTGNPVHRYKPTWMRYYFKSPAAEAVSALKLGGFRVMSLANNHSMDTGAKGLRDTMAALDEADILAVGAGRNEAEALRSVWVPSSQGGGIRFIAFCNVGPPGTFATKHSPGAAFLKDAVVLKAVKKAVAEGGPVAVSLHWGIEQQRDSPVADPLPYQRRLARQIIDAGAMLVLGHHTHAVSRFEERGQGLIVYSLGNFLFSGSRISQRRRSVILQVDLDESGVQAWNLVPVRIDAPEQPFQPEPLNKADGEAYLNEVLGPNRASFAHYGPVGRTGLEALGPRP